MKTHSAWIFTILFVNLSWHLQCCKQHSCAYLSLLVRSLRAGFCFCSFSYFKCHCSILLALYTKENFLEYLHKRLKSELIWQDFVNPYYLPHTMGTQRWRSGSLSLKELTVYGGANINNHTVWWEMCQKRDTWGVVGWQRHWSWPWGQNEASFNRGAKCLLAEMRGKVVINPGVWRRDGVTRQNLRSLCVWGTKLIWYC